MNSEISLQYLEEHLLWHHSDILLPPILLWGEFNFLLFTWKSVQPKTRWKNYVDIDGTLLYVKHCIQTGLIHGSHMRTNSTFHFMDRWKQQSYCCCIDVMKMYGRGEVATQASKDYLCLWINQQDNSIHFDVNVTAHESTVLFYFVI